MMNTATKAEKLDSHNQWHAARIGRDERERKQAEAAMLSRLHGCFKPQHHADAERFAIPAFRGETLPELDGPMPE